MNDETKKYIEKLGDVELKNVGSSIKIIWIAENYADIYPRIAPTMEWDTCAADAILREMKGGCMKYSNENKYLTYNKENLLNPFFVAKKLEI
jgi:3'(2'), 5'-bisphosphate nucleotidase